MAQHTTTTAVRSHRSRALEKARRKVTSSSDKKFPANEHLEREVAASIILGHVDSVLLLTTLQPDDFSNSTYRTMFTVAQNLFNDLKPFDVAAIYDEMLKKYPAELAEIGDLDGLVKIKSSTYAQYNAKHACEVIQRYADQRYLLQVLQDYSEEAWKANADPGEVAAQLTQQLADHRAQSISLDWRKALHTVEELPEGGLTFLIDRILPAGVSFIGGLSGTGKTWLALSQARALVTGKKFLGIYNVPARVNVIYLVPEMNAGAFKARCRRFGIGGDGFYCRTISDGVPLDLSDPVLLAAIRELKPVVYLDTAIRFSNSEDENSAAENQGLARAIFALIYTGARAVVCLHHRGKDKGHDDMTLENSLRGTGDLGAIADCVWGLQYNKGSAAHLKESRKLVRLDVRCVKARDFCPPEDFRIQLDPFIDQIGDMGVLLDEPEPEKTEGEILCEAIATNPKATKVQLQDATGIGRNRIEKVAAPYGWQYEPMKGWEKSDTAP